MKGSLRFKVSSFEWSFERSLPIWNSLRGLCDLGVSAVNIRFKYTHRGDAENAEGGAENLKLDTTLELNLKPEN